MPTLLGRVKNSLSLGLFSGLGGLIILILDYVILLFWEFMSPAHLIERAADFDYFKYKTDKEAFGDHTFKVNEYDIN